MPKSLQTVSPPKKDFILRHLAGFQPLKSYESVDKSEYLYVLFRKTGKRKKTLCKIFLQYILCIRKASLTILFYIENMHLFVSTHLYLCPIDTAKNAKKRGPSLKNQADAPHLLIKILYF